MPYFLNPVFLSAAALIGIPLLIHLIRRRRIRVVQWAAMEFLLLSQKKQKRRMHIEELLLLLLRMLIVLIAVLAFARPVMRAIGVPLISQNARIYAVIVLDNSYSMDFTSDGRTSFQRAKDTAETILNKVLKPGDAASLVMLNSRGDAVVSAPSFDLNLVKQRVRQARVSDRGTDYFAAAKEVQKLLRVSNNPHKEVYWITDDQESAWLSSRKGAAQKVWTDVGNAARVTWVSVGPPAGQRDNLAVEAPVLGRELVTPQLPARIEAKIFNYGSRVRRDLLVNLFVDGHEAGAQRIAVDPGQSSMVRFIHLFSQQGIHTGRIEIGDPTHVDRLAHDNAQPFVVRSRDRIKVLVQDMRPSRDPMRSESFYLMTAMAPSGAAESLAPKLRTGEGLGNINLRDYDAVVLTGVSNVSPQDVRALSDYMRAGGGVVIFPGPATDARALNQAMAGLLPARLGAKRVLPEANGVTLNPATITHPVMAIFRDTSTMNVGSALFTTYFPLEPAVDASDPNAVQVMIRFSNGDPYLVERRVGLGRIILAASSAGIGWNQLPLKPTYVPMVYQLTSYLGQGPVARRNLAQDETMFLNLPLSDANKSVRVIDPAGKVSRQNSVLGPNGVTFNYTGTGAVGIYRVNAVGGKTDDAFSVTMPVTDANLAPSDPVSSATVAGLPFRSITAVASPDKLQMSVNRARYGAEVWRPLIWLLLPLLFLESLLAERFGRRG